MLRERRKRVFYQEIKEINNKFGHFKLMDNFLCTSDYCKNGKEGKIIKLYKNIYQEEETKDKYIIYLDNDSIHDLNCLN